MLDFIGGRKVAMGLLILGIAVAVLLVRGDVPPNFKELLAVVFGAFVVGNGFEHVAGAVANNKEGPVDTIEELAAVSAKLEAQVAEVKASLDAGMQGSAEAVSEIRALAERAADGAQASAAALAIIMESRKGK